MPLESLPIQAGNWSSVNDYLTQIANGGSLPLNVKDAAWRAKGDGVTDDTAAINTALAAASAAGNGRVYMPPGTYLIGSRSGGASINVPSNVEWYGAGNTTVLLIAADPVVNPIVNATNTGWVNVSIHDFKIDGNKAAITSATGANPDINATSGTGNNQIMYLSSNDGTPATAIYVDRLTVINSVRLGIVLQNIQGGAVRGCTVTGNQRDGITLFYNCQDVKIIGNTVSQCGDDHIGLNCENGSTTGHTMQNIVVNDNNIIGPSPRSKGKGIAVRGVTKYTVAGNVVDSVSESAIYLANFNSSNLVRGTVSGNTIHNAGSGGSSNKNGIIAQANNAVTTATGTRGTITHLTIAGNTITGCGSDGILVDSGPSGLTPPGFSGAADGDIQFVTITGNTIVSNSGNGVWINSGPIDDVTIGNNICNSNTQSGIAVIGSTGPSPHKRVTINGNTVNGNTVNGINGDTVAAIIVVGNQLTNNAVNGLRLATITLACQLSPNSYSGNGNGLSLASVSSTIVAQQYSSNGLTFSKPLGGATGPQIATVLNTLGITSFSAGRTTVADTAYTALATDAIIAYTSLTAGRTVTLNAASARVAGAPLTIKDETNSASTKNITVTCAGADTFTDGTASKTVTTNSGFLNIYSDGSTKWHVVGSG